MNLPLVDSAEPDMSTAVRQYQVNRQLELFRIQEDPHLIYRGGEPVIVLRYLQRRVAARPKQLRNHIRRVYLSIQSREAGHLTGALVDLMLVLRGKGRHLIKRMLEQSEPLLTPTTLDLMRQASETGDPEPLRALSQGESVLGNGGVPAVAPLQ
ncbi:MAG: hypothetical protein CMI01_07640 [Oceanospirillaceae bacterium]|jgi:hypothetical protein|uniref:hypothetical protein n=1 Tax=Marinobacterium litorale TaxID=404770 RepID=UPI000419F49E|nr:hypothetical protein [Marinobacterium litorale]MBS98534.1 hypothetical protein [Oceanospirillaceae bacterium]